MCTYLNNLDKSPHLFNVAYVCHKKTFENIEWMLNSFFFVFNKYSIVVSKPFNCMLDDWSNKLQVDILSDLSLWKRVKSKFSEALIYRINDNILNLCQVCLKPFECRDSKLYDRRWIKFDLNCTTLLWNVECKSKHFSSRSVCL